jgi:hypothetical protein
MIQMEASKFMQPDKRTPHYRGVAIAAFMIIAAATVALEFYTGHQLEYSGFTL